MQRIALVLALAFAAQPAFAGTGAFDEFKKYCIDTGIDLDAVGRAAKAAGGLAGPSESSNGPWAQRITRWRFKGFAIEAAAKHVPALPGASARYSTECAITGFKPGTDVLARLGQWAGVPREKGAAVYTFLERNGKHLALPHAQTAYFAALATGRVWELVIEADGTIRLVHYILA